MEAQNQILLDDKVGGKGKFFTTRFLQAGLVKYSFGVCLLDKETIDRFIYNFVGCPVIINHKDVTSDSAKNDRVGVISRVWFNEQDGWYWGEGIIFEQEALDLIDKGYNVSCQYEITEYSSTGGIHNGNEYDKTILNGKPEHLAIVKNPRYENAMIAVNAIEATNEDNFKTLRDSKGHKYVANIGKGFKSEVTKLSRQSGVGYTDFRLRSDNYTVELDTDAIDVDKKVYNLANIFGGSNVSHEINNETQATITINTRQFFDKQNNAKKKSKKQESVTQLKLDLDAQNNIRLAINELKDEIMQAINEDKWITIHPHGEEGKGKPLLLKDGETPKEAIERTYGKKGGSKSSEGDKDYKPKKEGKKEDKKEETKESSAEDKKYKDIHSATKVLERILEGPFIMKEDMKELENIFDYKITTEDLYDAVYETGGDDDDWIPGYVATELSDRIEQAKAMDKKAERKRKREAKIQARKDVLKYDLKRALQRMSPHADYRYDDESNILEVRYLGNWEGDDGSGDYDWQTMTESSRKKVGDIIKEVEKRTKFKISFHTGEKNWSYFELIDKKKKAKNDIIMAINEIKGLDMFKNLFRKKEKNMDREEIKEIMMECLTELTASNEAEKKDEPDYKKMYEDLKAECEAKAKNEEKEEDIEEEKEEVVENKCDKAKAKNEIEAQKEAMMSEVVATESTYITQSKARELGKELF